MEKNFLVGTPQRGSADEFIHTVRAGMNWPFH
jgi:hypothetical protein